MAQQLEDAEEMRLGEKNRFELIKGRFEMRFLSQSLLAFAIKLGSAGLSFAMFVLLARALERTSYGVFGAIFSLATLLAVIGSLGQRAIVLRFGASYHETNKDALRRGVIHRGYFIVVVGGLTSGIVGALLYSFPSKSPDLGWIAAIAGLTLSWALLEYQSYVMRISGGVALSLIPRDICWRLLICGLACAAILGWLPAEPGPQGWSWIMAGSLILIGAVQFWLNERRNSTTERIVGPAVMRHREWNKPMLHLWLSSVIMLAVQSLSVILIEMQIGADEAGPYFSALRTAQLLNLCLFATSVICSPLLSRSLTRADLVGSQKVCTLTALIGGGFGVAVFLIILVFGGMLLRLFGAGFDDMTHVLIILATGFLVNTLAGPTGPLLEMSGHEAAYFRVLFVANLIGLVALPFMIFWFGTVGAALCTAAIAVSWNVAAVIYSRRKIGIDPSVSIFILGEPSMRPQT